MSVHRLPLLLLCWLLSVLAGLNQSLAVGASFDGALIQQQPAVLSPYLGLLEDPSGQLSFAEVRSATFSPRFVQQTDSSSIAIGFSRSAYWLRIPLSNSSSAAIDRLLVLANPRIADVQLYVPDAQGRYQHIVTGSDTPAATRQYANRNFVFPLRLPAQSDNALYMRVASNIGILLPLQLWTPTVFSQAERADYVAQAWYFGMASAMIIFNLLLAIALRERIYGLYVLFATTTTYTFAIKNGLAPDWPWLGMAMNSNAAYFSGVSIALVSMLWFMRRMLQTDVVLPRIDRWLRLNVALYLLSVVLYSYSLATFARFGIVLNLISIILILAVAVACSIKRQRSAYFFLGAFGLLMLGGAVTTLRAMGVLPNNPFTTDGIQFASACEMLLLAFALADRINSMRRDKAKVQQQLLATQASLVSTLQNSEKELERRVALRTEELRLSNAQLETMSLTDALTGIANRRRFDLTLDQEWNRARRMQTPIALAVIDVDCFKQYNDLYGHPGGDYCLRQIAETLAKLCRASDLVARYGGEEFVILAPMTELAGATRMAEKILEAVSTLDLPHAQGPTGRVSVSLGFAVTWPHAANSCEQLLQEADKALYQAKQQGRNQFVAVHIAKRPKLLKTP